MVGDGQGSQDGGTGPAAERKGLGTGQYGADGIQVLHGYTILECMQGGIGPDAKIHVGLVLEEVGPVPLVSVGSLENIQPEQTIQEVDNILKERIARLKKDLGLC